MKNMKDNYSFKQFFQYVYRKEGQKFVRPEKGKEEMEEWQKKFRSELSEQLGLNRLSRLADGFPGSDIRLKTPDRRRDISDKKLSCGRFPLWKCRFMF